MKGRVRAACCLMALALMSMSVYAVDLKNQDGTRYEIKINSGATASSSSIEGNTTQSNVCGDCEIEVTGVGKISASGSETVIIKDGKLSKQ